MKFYLSVKLGCVWIKHLFLCVVAGLEKAPLAKSHENQGRLVFEYEPICGSFVSFLKK